MVPPPSTKIEFDRPALRRDGLRKLRRLLRRLERGGKDESGPALDFGVRGGHYLGYLPSKNGVAGSRGDRGVFLKRGG